MCVLKRHTTRFFPTKRQDRDENGNPNCGLVVYDKVTYENAYDFYLQSHACIQGTARPAHYVVLVDEIELPMDVVQQEVSRKSHLAMSVLARCRLTSTASYLKSIGINPAARYADRACDRGRNYLHSAFSAGNNSSQTFNPTVAGWTGGVHRDFADQMFFI